MKEREKRIFTIPNLLSCLRLLLIPFFVGEYLGAAGPGDYGRAALIILASGATDLLDGYIARRFDCITELGKTLDPVADKLTQAAILLCLLLRYRLMLILVGILAARDLFMAVNGLILLRRGKKLNGASWFGKMSTAVFYAASVILIAFPGLPAALASGIMLVVGGCLLLSFLLYIPLFIQMYQSGKSAVTGQKERERI